MQSLLVSSKIIGAHFGLPLELPVCPFHRSISFLKWKKGCGIKVGIVVSFLKSRQTLLNYLPTINFFLILYFSFIISELAFSLKMFLPSISRSCLISGSYIHVNNVVIKTSMMSSEKKSSRCTKRISC